MISAWDEESRMLKHTHRQAVEVQVNTVDENITYYFAQTDDIVRTWHSELMQSKCKVFDKYTA
jgi:hypothetical protein